MNLFLASLLRRGCAFAFAGLVAAAAHAADAWPTRPVKIVVPAASGSAPDVAMRALADRMAAHLKQPVLVDNRPGAGGVVALRALQAAHDDHSLLFVVTSSAAIAPVTMRGAAGVDYLRDLRPVVRLAHTPLMIVAGPKATATSLSGMLEAAKARPGALTFATPGVSTLGSLAVQWLADRTGARFLAVPFLRPGDGVSAVLGGEADYYIDGISVVLPLVRSGKLRPVAVLSRTRLPGLQDLPVAEESLKDFEVVGRFGLMAPPELPAAAIDVVARAAIAALGDAGVTAKLTTLGLYPHPGQPADYQATLQEEITLWGRIARQAKIQPE